MALIRIPDLLPGTVYNFQVRSKDDSHASEWSPVWSITVPVDNIPPATPTNPTWDVVGDSFHAEWDAVTTNTNVPAPDTIPITRYEVELVANSITKILSVSPVTGEKPKFDLPFETNKALFAGARPTVTFRVRAVDNKELKSAWTTVISKTNPAPAAPTAPSSGSVATSVAAGIKLAWTNSTSDDVVRYHIYAGTTSGFTPSAANRVYAGLANPFTYSTLSYSTQYFKIFAVDKFEQESTTSLNGDAAALDPFNFDTTPPADPTGFDVTISDDPAGILLTQRASATWTYNTSDTSIKGFHVQYKKDTDTNWRTVSVMKDNLTFPFIITTGLDPNVAYSFRVRSYDEYANYSGWATDGTAATTPTVQPTLFHSIEIGGGGFIQSQDYDGVGGSFGFYLDDNELNINNGNIRGETITVGSIRSSELAVFPDGSTQAGKYKWQIDLEGDAILGNTWVKGSLVVGEEGESVLSVAQSRNFDSTTNTTGWIIRSDGSARFNKVDANSFSGDAIIANTLTVDKLASGNMTAGIELFGTGGIFSTGSLGQSVRMSSDGFSVASPPTARVTNVVIATGAVTLTTDIANAVAVGDLVRVLDIPAFIPPDETFTVTEVTGTTVKFNAPGLASGSSAVSGRIQGGALVTGKSQELLVDFPSDGLRPNIISGLLTGDTILSRNNLIIFDSASIEPGAEITLSSGVTNPKAQPSLRSSLPKEEVAGFTHEESDISDFYIPVASNVDTSTGYVYTLGQGAWEDANSYKLEVTVQRWNESTRVVTEVMPKTLIVNGSKGVGSYLYGAKVRGFVLSDGYWWTLLKRSFYLPQTNSFWERLTLLRLDPSTWARTEYDIVQTASGWYRDWALGKDHTTANSLVFVRASSATTSVKDPEFHGGSPALTSGNMNAYRITTSGGVPTMSGGFVSMTSLGTLNAVGGAEKTAVEMGVFDHGTGNERIIVKDVPDYYNINFGFIPYPITGGSYDSTRSWSSTIDSGLDGNFYWNPTKGKFYQGNWSFVDTNLVKMEVHEYQGGAAFWVSSESGGKFYVGYSWYDSVSPTQETQIGATSSIYLDKRHTISVTVPEIPYRGTSDYPDRAKIWVVRSNTQPAITSTNWKRRGQIFYPDTNTLVDLHNADAGETPKAANEFPNVGSATPSQIISATGNSYWKGDDTAQFYQLVLTSGSDASTAANNKPPLRIGNPASTHLRIDNNEIIAMTGNSTQGGLVLNAGGQTSVTDLSIGTIVGGVTGAGTLVMGSIRGTASVIDLSYDGGGTTGASVNNAGRFVRTTSSERYKDNITPMTLDTAHQALSLQAVTFSLKDEIDMETRPVYPGFIAEQADEVGANLWVFKDSQGRPDGFRYAELTAAHNMLIKELYERIAVLEEQLNNLGS